MKPTLLYAYEEKALPNWLQACDNNAEVLKSLADLGHNAANGRLLMIQIGSEVQIEQINKLCQLNFDILALSNTPTDAEGLKLFQLGIKGYLNTYATIDRIKQAIDTIRSGNVWLGQSLMQTMFSAMQPAKQANDGWKELLTARELATAELVLESLSNKQIAKQLNITERTVKAHLHNIFQKLGVTDRLALALKIKNW
ncbi:response regulator transcription factor [Thiomicrorhabdus sp.]|uniref:response regulator transcription factor n=1 Tax=Thiomicrorhabdus sp. TaxID=2039724 RepID=UPI0029C78798|nr:response regulator transcription factor [Thiomicrorhabdus sp.]